MFQTFVKCLDISEWNISPCISNYGK